jgi:uncharacterized protein YdaU (DUF1376 family)
MPSNHIPYFRLYPADFMGGVRGMSAQEIGVYMMLLCRMYEENGPIEYHVLRLSTYCGMRQKTFEAVAEKLIALGKITLENGMMFNDRAEREISSRANDLENNIKAGKASAKKRQQKQRKISTPVQRPFNHTDTDTDTYNTEDKSSDGQAVDQVDFAKDLWDRGVAFLGRSGVNERQARSVIGKWRKAYTDTDIFNAFKDCSKAGVVEPISWIEARLKGKGKANDRLGKGAERISAFVSGAGGSSEMDRGEDNYPSQPLLARR